MTARQEVAKRETTEVQAKPREQEIVLAPAVDVFENADGITVQAEMPGVSKDRLNVQADRNSLLDISTDSVSAATCCTFRS